MRTMNAAEFKAKCLEVMDDVAATGEPVSITKRGRPVARLVAETAQTDADPLFGFWRDRIALEDDVVGSTFTADELDALERGADRLSGG